MLFVTSQAGSMEALSDSLSDDLKGWSGAMYGRKLVCKSFTTEPVAGMHVAPYNLHHNIESPNSL